MNTSTQVEVTKTTREDGYRIFKILMTQDKQEKQYEIYVFDKDLPIKEADITNDSLEGFAKKEAAIWVSDSDGKLPDEKYRVLTNGGKISTDDINPYISAPEKTSDLVRTNVTIYAPLFEWAKAQAKKEDTSFSELVSRGLKKLKNSDKDIEAWFTGQHDYFDNKLGDFGSLEIFHYLPNNYLDFDQETMKNALQKAEVRRTGWPIGAYLENSEQRPHPQPDGIKAEYEPSDYLLLDYWYARNKGEFYFARNLESDSGNGKAEPKTCLYFDTLIWRTAEALEHALNYYQVLRIDENERIKIRLSLYGLKNRTLSAWNPMRAFTLRHYTSGSDESSWEAEMNLRELKEQLDDVIYEATKKLLVLFDFFVPNKDVVLDILNKEYRKSNF